MNVNTNGLVDYYESLVHEYLQDIERSVHLARSASGDPFGALDRINRVLISEIARLKVQLLDIDLKVAKLGQAGGMSTFTPSSDNYWPATQVYAAGDTISIGSGTTTYGFHFVENTGDGNTHRWSGPSPRCGLVALIDRSESLIVEAPAITFIDDRVTIEQIDIDGEPVVFTLDASERLRFVIPALEKSPVPVMTYISLRLN